MTREEILALDAVAIAGAVRGGKLRAREAVEAALAVGRCR